MTRLILLVLPLWFAGAYAIAAEGIVFGPVRAQPGESIRMLSSSESKGTVEAVRDGRKSKGTIRIARDRDISWTFRAPDADGSLRGMVSVARIASTSSAMLDGKEEKAEDSSPLNGRMFAMSRTPAGEWKFDLDGSIPRQRIQDEIDELTVYLKRKWYPEQTVRVGDAWEFDPKWIRMVVQKDLPNAQVIGTMKLRQVRRSARKSLAIIDVSVRSTGGDFRADGSESKLQMDLNGQVTVDLATMLDERLELNGVIVTEAGKLSDSKKVTLPVNLMVTKSFVRSAMAP